MIRAIFVFNLVQDVNILRPIVYMASRDCSYFVELIVFDKFLKRDSLGLWMKELRYISSELNIPLHLVTGDYEAYKIIENKNGYLLAGSESNLSAHADVHNLFKISPSSLIKITLQHGYECVGFLQNRQHIKAHGNSVRFAADIICGWCDKEMLVSVNTSEINKLKITGPTAVLQNSFSSSSQKVSQGVVCENLHSVRLNTTSVLKYNFVETFTAFCDYLSRKKSTVALRPHPGGQYVLKNDINLPKNVDINNQPMYKVELSRYQYGISAPSSVIIDMVLAKIPVAVWVDEDGVVDADHYTGLTKISSVEEWVEFTERAILEPKHFLDLQEEYLKSIKIKYNPEDVYNSYYSILNSYSEFVEIYQGHSVQNRVLFVSNAHVPTLQLSFVKPLKKSLEDGSVLTEYLTEEELRNHFQKDITRSYVCSYIDRKILQFSPTVIVFCRYSGPHYQYIHRLSEYLGIPCLYHIDDDLLGIPEDIGHKKFLHHNSKSRLSSVQYLLRNVDLVYASTEKLKEHLLSKVDIKNIISGDIYCSGSIIKEPTKSSVSTIGYMASADHAHNLSLVLPAIVKILDKYQSVNLEFFGSIPKPDELERFGSRIKQVAPIKDYENFLIEFSKQNWDIGICPLSPIHFNMMKANTKWVEYSSVGIAVIASKGTVYDSCCDNDCGILASTVEEWYQAMSALIESPEKKQEIVLNAQRKINDKYSLDVLRKQIIDVFDYVKEIKTE